MNDYREVIEDLEKSFDKNQGKKSSEMSNDTPTLGNLQNICKLSKKGLKLWYRNVSIYEYGKWEQRKRNEEIGRTEFNKLRLWYKWIDCCGLWRGKSENKNGF